MTRSEAKKIKEKYYEGRSCKYCGGTKRLVRNGRCADYMKIGKGHWGDSSKFRVYLAKNREGFKFDQIKRKYGITRDDWHWMLKEQNYRCKMCKKIMNEKWAVDSRNGRYRSEIYVDHDHKTGKVRGMLCHACNTVIGHADDNVTILNSAIKYLEENNTN
jgi:hypothetical protein